MTTPSSSSRSPVVGLGAQAAGIVGIGICVALIVAVWLVHGAVSGAIDGLAEDVNRGFQRAVDATEAVATRLDEAATNVEAVATEATELASSSSPSPERLPGLQARLGQVANRYGEVRVRYAEAKVNLTSVVTTLQRIARIVPGTRVPQDPPGVLAAVDDKLVAVDQAITATWSDVQEADPASAVASGVAERATNLATAVSDAAAATRGVSANIESAQTEAADAISAIRTILLFGALVISAALLWILLLHILLWRLGGSWRRGRASTQAS